MHRLFSWLIGEYIPLTECGIRGKPSKTFRGNEVIIIFDCPVYPGAKSNYLRFPASYLARRVVQNMESLEAFLPEAPYELIKISYPKESLTERIRCMIGHNLSAELPTFDELTEIFQTSATTLRRNLRSENTSYQQIKDNCRHDLAIRLLTQQEFTGTVA